MIKGRGITLFSIVIGAITIGALYPTNLSDIYTYLPLGFAVLGYSIWRSNSPPPAPSGMPDWFKKLALTVGSVLLFTVAVTIAPLQSAVDT